jgi:NAD(P)-dependent dehydrogenase (short-subunit alcohol dehydrogenase family)
VVNNPPRVCISFDAVGISERFGYAAGQDGCGAVSLPISAYTTSYLAHDPKQIRSDHDRHRAPRTNERQLDGGYGPARAAKEALTRNLSYETPASRHSRGQSAARMSQSCTMKEIFDVTGKAFGMTWEQFTGHLASATHPRRHMTLAEMANVAAFLASDQASWITGTTVNLTMGSADD